MSYLVDIIKIIRKVRLENKIPKDVTLDINILVKDDIKKIEKNIDFFNTYLTTLKTRIKNVSTVSMIGNKITEIAPLFVIEIPYEKDDENEVLKIKKLISELEVEVERSENILGNQSFLTKAPKSKIDEEKNKLKKYKDQLQSAKDSLAHLKVTF